MRKVRAWFALVCVFWMLVVQQQAYAQAALAPVENYVVNRAIGGMIANRIAMARGIAANDATWMAQAANDATYKATMAGVGKVMNGANVASTALGIGLTIAGAPVWLTVAAGLGVVVAGSLIAHNVSNGAEMRIVNTASGNKIQVQSPRPALPSYSAPMVPEIPKGLQQAIAVGAHAYRHESSCFPGSFCYSYPPVPANLPMSVGTDYGVVLGAGDILTLSKAYVLARYGDMNGPDNLGMGTTFSIEATSAGFVYADDGTPSWYVWIREQRYGCVAPTCDPVNDLPNYDRTYFEYPQYGQKFAPGTYAKQYTSLDQAASAISMDSGTKAVKVSQQILADTANKAWQQAAAQPGYAGEPYPVAQPLTSLDVARWTSANPTSDPTIDDLLRPATNPATYPEGVPISPTIVYVTPTPTNPTSPTTNGNVNVVNTPNVNVVNNVKVDFGPDPGVGAPGLETPPTGAEILQPLTTLFPEFRSFQTPQHVGECPKPAFDVFGKSIVMEAQCTIAEQQRASLAAVMMVVWLLVGLFILLSA